jgi:hypothetical protein
LANDAAVRARRRRNADSDLIANLRQTMRENLAGRREAGHNVILPTLALKAMRDAPDAITPSRVAGICSMVRLFKRTDVTWDDSDPVDLPDDNSDLARFVLGEFVDCSERFVGTGQGWTGHLLTYAAAALIDLCELGHTDTAFAARPAFETYIRRIRTGPLDTDNQRPEHPSSDLFPTDREYWEQQTGRDWNFGHVTKYPYGFYRLLSLVEDSSLKQRCLEVAYRIF